MKFILASVVVSLMSFQGSSQSRPEYRRAGSRVTPFQPRSAIESQSSEVDYRQSPAFSVLSHLAHPYALQPVLRPSRPDSLPLQIERDIPETRQLQPVRRQASRMKPTFEIGSDPHAEQSISHRQGQPSYVQEGLYLPPVYVPKKPSTVYDLEKQPAYSSRPQYSQYGDSHNDVRTPAYTQSNSLPIEEEKPVHISSIPDSIRIPDIDGVYLQESQYSDKDLYTPDIYKQEPEHFVNRDIKRQPIYSPQQELKTSVIPKQEPDSHAQFPNQRELNYLGYANVPNVPQQTPERVKSIVTENAFSPKKTNQRKTNSFQNPDPNLVRLPESSNIAEPILKQRPFTQYDEEASKLKPTTAFSGNWNDQKKDKRQTYGVHAGHNDHGGHGGYGHTGGHGAGPYLDSNGIEFVAEAAKVEKKPRDGRIAFQIHGQQGPHSYRFGYDTGKGYNRQFRYEERDGYGEVKGRYGYHDKDGKLQIVNYSAHPEHGFHADVLKPHRR